MISKVSAPIQLTKSSNVSLQEMAFTFMQEAEDVY
jgi:hypothetical protein